MGKQQLRRAIAGAGSIALAGALGSSAQAQVAPSVVAVSVCTPAEEYLVEGHATGFPPDTDVVRMARMNGQMFHNFFRTDADGNGVDFRATGQAVVPYSGWIRYYSDDNGSGWADEGDTLILAGTLTISAPCQGAPVVPK